MYITHIVKFEGQDEVEIDFVNTPNRGDIIIHNDEPFEVKTIHHFVEKVTKRNAINVVTFNKFLVKKVTIFAVKAKRL